MARGFRQGIKRNQRPTETRKEQHIERILPHDTFAVLSE